MNNAEEYLNDITMNSDLGSYDVVKCPFCGCECVHPERVVVNAGGVITIIEDQIPWIIHGTPTDRGVSFWLHFACESGHRWVEEYHFNKGSTIKKLIFDGVFKPDKDWPRAIWRD